MGKLRQTALILGEGPTEFFYFKSLCDVFKRLTIKPDYPKHTNIKELDAKIAEGVAMGYSHIFCIIDMDTKDKEPERSQYQKLKAKYAKPIDKPKKGIYCEVEFFETHRCTELFFLYYFRYTSRPYETQEPLLKDLNQCVEYRKTIEFFIKTKGLHGYFERNGGSLEKAIANAHRSMDEKLKNDRDYTYSELGRLIERLKKLVTSHEQLKQIMTEEQERVLSDEQLKKTFEKITKAIDKNSELREFKKVIENHPNWIIEMLDYDLCTFQSLIILILLWVIFIVMQV